MTGNIEVTILGCGSSGGVPRVGGDWGACDPNEPKNRRTRCSLWVEYWEGDTKPERDKCTSVLIDTSPDLREQLLAIEIKRLDALFFTHEHADQTHGIDDLRALAYRMRQRVPRSKHSKATQVKLSALLSVPMADGLSQEVIKGRSKSGMLQLVPNFKHLGATQIT